MPLIRTSRSSNVDRWRLRLMGLLCLLGTAVVLAGCYLMFDGSIGSSTRLTVLAGRSGLTLEVGSKVTLNGVRIGRVTSVEETTVDGGPGARVTLAIDSRYLAAIPANVDVGIRANTVFGGKNVALVSPPHPAGGRIDPSTPLSASSVTTEFNTLFETLVSVAGKV